MSDEETMQLILDRLALARKRAGLSQGQAAQLMGYTATSTISHYESGARELSLENFLKLCDLYGISPLWAITGKGSDFDHRLLLQKSRMAAQDARKLAELLESLSTNE